jgi:hypothetical protein
MSIHRNNQISGANSTPPPGVHRVLPDHPAEEKEKPLAGGTLPRIGEKDTGIAVGSISNLFGKSLKSGTEVKTLFRRR